jgi:hypothetical protein
MKRLLAVSATAVLTLALITPSAGADAETDTTPPDLWVQTSATFVTGTTIGPMLASPWQGVVSTGDIVMRTDWSATDASGICGYSYRAIPGGWWPDPWSDWSEQTSLVGPETDYFDQEGGGSGTIIHYELRARDCAGNVAETTFRRQPAVYQETGESYGWGRAFTSTYIGAWTSVECLDAAVSCPSGGAAKTTHQRHARVQFAFTEAARARPVGLVMTTGPDRGKAALLVNGRRVANIDTWSATYRPRRVVWAGELPPGEPTLEVMAFGAPAPRSRIDVDAIMVSQ